MIEVNYFRITFHIFKPKKADGCGKNAGYKEKIEIDEEKLGN